MVKGKSRRKFFGFFNGPELVITVNVDDLLIIGETRRLVKQLKQSLAKRVLLEDLGYDATDYPRH